MSKQLRKDNHRIIFISSNEPIPTFRRKINLLYRKNYEVHLIYWHRNKSLINMPMTLDIPTQNIIKIELLEPFGNFFKRLLLNMVFFFRVKKYISALKPDALHINNIDIFILFASMKIFYRKMHFVLDLIDTREGFLKSAASKVSRWSLKALDLVFVTSPRYYDDFLKLIDPGLPSERVLFVPNAPLRSDFEGFRKNKRDDITIGYFGFLRGYVSISQLVSVLNELNATGKKFSVIFAGIGQERPLVEKLAAQYSFVEYFGPFDYKDILKLYQRVDLIYSVYLLDHNKKIHMSCRLSEAINCGIPIIVQNGSYQADYVRKYDIGYVVDYGQQQQLFDILEYLYDHRDDVCRKSENCQNIKHEHVFETYEDRIVEKYDELVRSRVENS